MTSVPVLSDAAEAFAVFASEQNVTRAARKLFISQPALHQKLRKFASEVGVPLWENHRGSLVLTEAGKAMAKFVYELQRSRDEFALTLASHRTRPVVVAAGEGAFLYLLGDAVAEALAGPGPGLELVTTDAPTALAAVVDGDADIAVSVFSNLPRGKEAVRVHGVALTISEIAKVTQVLACPTAHPLAKRRTISLADLGGEPLVVSPRGRPTREALEQALVGHNQGLAVAVEARGWDLTLSFVAMGAGCAVINGFVPPRHGLRFVRIRDLPQVSYQAIVQSGNLSDLAVGAVFDSLVRAAQVP